MVAQLQESETNLKALQSKYDVTRQRLRILGGVSMLEKFSRNAQPKDEEKKGSYEPSVGILQSNQSPDTGSWVSRRFRDLHPDSASSGRKINRSLSMSSPMKRRDTWVDVKPSSQKLEKEKPSLESSTSSSLIEIPLSNSSNSIEVTLDNSSEQPHNIPPSDKDTASQPINDSVDVAYESALTPRGDELDSLDESIISTNENEDISRIRKMGGNVLLHQTERLGESSTYIIDEKDNTKTVLEWIVEEFNEARETGLKQKMEIEKIRKMEKMMLLTPEKQKSESNLKAKQSPRSMRNFVVTAPRNFKLTSQKAETEEMERIFYITKDYIENPSDKRVEDDSRLSQKTRDRISICKESLSFTVNLSDCELSSLPDTVKDNLRKAKILDLSKNLIESISSDIGVFDELEELILSHNKIKQIPVSIHKLNKLQVLMLNNNQITSLPSTIGFFYHLTILDLSENNLLEIPKQIGFLENLRSLNVGHNLRVNAIPKEIGYLVNLQMFESSYCTIKEIPKELCCLTSLQYVNLSHNHIEEIPIHIGLLTKVSILNLSNNSLRQIPETITLCTQLATGLFDVSNNPLDFTYDAALDSQTFFDKIIESMKDKEAPVLNIADCQPPRRLPMLPVTRATEYEDDVYTLQEKMQCLSKWCTHTINTYLNPSLLHLSKRIQALQGFDNDNFYDIVSTIKQILTFIKRSEDSLPKSDQDLRNWKDEEDDMKRTQAFLLNQLLIIEQVIKRSENMLHQLSHLEQVRDIAQIVYIVHFIREMLFIMVLKE